MDAFNKLNVCDQRRLMNLMMAKLFIKIRMKNKEVIENIDMVADVFHNLPYFLSSDVEFLKFDINHFWQDAKDCGVYEIIYDIWLDSLNVMFLRKGY